MIRIMSGLLKRFIFDLVDEFDVDIEREANIIEVLWIIMLSVHGGVIIDPGETKWYHKFDHIKFFRVLVSVDKYRFLLLH